MVDDNKNGKRPDYKSDGVAIWINKTKDNETYLSVKMVGHNAVNVFKNTPKEDKPKVEEIRMNEL